MNRIWTIFAIVLIFPWLSSAQYFQKISSGGIIDWTELVVRETGIGFPNPNLPISVQRSAATETAKKEAENKLFNLIKSLNLNSQSTVEQYLNTNDSLINTIRKYLENIKVIDIRYKSDRAVEVEAEVPLSLIFKAILPEQFLLSPDTTETTDLSEISPTPVIYTGLILDARGLKMNPAIYPEIYDEKNQPVYNIRRVNFDYIYQRGVTCYEKNLERARANKRITNNPLIIKALDVRGKNNTDAIVSNQNAEKILAAHQMSDFLKKGRVIFVID